MQAEAREWAATPRLLRTRPTVVEAIRVTPETRDAIVRWINETASAWPYGTRGVTWVAPDVGGIADAFVGDWVVKTAFGEFIKVPDSQLFARYEMVVTVVAE